MITGLKRAKTKHIPEPNRETWLAQTTNDAYRFGFKSVDTLEDVNGKLVRAVTSAGAKIDRTLRMPDQPLRARDMPTVIEKEDAPPQCELCGDSLDTDFVDGVVKGMGGWANMCVGCHKNTGIGLGTGRGQHYKQDAEGNFTKVEG